MLRFRTTKGISVKIKPWANGALEWATRLYSRVIHLTASLLGTSRRIFRKSDHDNSAVKGCDGIAARYLASTSSRQAMASSSTRTASSMGTTGLALNSNAGSMEQNL